MEAKSPLLKNEIKLEKEMLSNPFLDDEIKQKYHLLNGEKKPAFLLAYDKDQTAMWKKINKAFS